jgi:hypothetical protein
VANVFDDVSGRIAHGTTDYGHVPSAGTQARWALDGFPGSGPILFFQEAAQADEIEKCLVGTGLEI